MFLLQIVVQNVDLFGELSPFKMYLSNRNFLKLITCRYTIKFLRLVTLRLQIAYFELCYTLKVVLFGIYNLNDNFFVN